MSEYEPTEIEFEAAPVVIDTRDLGKVISTGFIIRRLGLPDTIWNWRNVKLRTFKDSTFDHIEVWDAETEQINAVPIEDGNRPLVDALFEAEFSYQFDPVPDTDTYEWWVGWQKNLGAIAVKNFLDQPELWDEA